MRRLMNASATLTVALGAAVCLSAQPPDFTPPTPLFAAVLRNDTAAIKESLARGADPNEAQFLGFTPVFFPIINQNLDALRENGEARRRYPGQGSGGRDHSQV